MASTWTGLSPWATAAEVLEAFGVTLAKAAPPSARHRKPVTRITDLTVTEISLVPTPANQHAKVVLFKSGTPVERPGPDLPVGWAEVVRKVASGEIGGRRPPTAAITPEAVPSTPLGREALVRLLEAHGREVLGMADIDPLTAQDAALRTPGGLAILKMIQAAA